MRYEEFLKVRDDVKLNWINDINSPTFLMNFINFHNLEKISFSFNLFQYF